MGLATCIIELVAYWRWMVRFVHRFFFSWIGNALCTNWTEGWMFPKISLEVWKRQTLLPLLVIELQCLGLTDFVLVTVPSELPRLYVAVNRADNVGNSHYVVFFNLPF